MVVGHCAETLDERGVGVGGGEERAIGDDDADVKRGRVDTVTATDQRIGEEVGHDLLMPTTVALGAGALGGDVEALADPRAVDPGDQSGDPRHPVVGASHGHVPLLLRGLVSRGRTGRVEGMEDPRRLVTPLLRPTAFELGEPGGEDLVDLSALLRGRRAEHRADPVGRLREHARGGERRHHPGHAAHETAGGREGAPRDRAGGLHHPRRFGTGHQRRLA